MGGAVNQPLDAYRYVFDIGTGTGHLIDYTFVNSMKPSTYPSLSFKLTRP